MGPAAVTIIVNPGTPQMKEQISISIPQRCSQRREDMEIVPGGRYCSACEQKVFDFTAMSDDEVLRFLQQQGTSPFCGQFLVSQLDRPITPVPPPAVFRLNATQRFIGSLLLFQSVMSGVQAQVKRKPVKTVQTAPDGRKTGYIIRGRILDEVSRQPVPGISVMAGGRSDTTDGRGRFRIELDSSYVDGQQVEVRTGKDSDWKKGTNAVLPALVTLDQSDRKELVLYRLPQELLPRQRKTAERVVRPIIDTIVSGGIASVGITRKATLMQRLRYRIQSVFRKKARQD
jgi:hypothetical protein